MQNTEKETQPEMMLEIGANGFRMNTEMLKYSEAGEIATVREIIDHIAGRRTRP